MLILVVALLVLLALVGTAYLTTTRFDRAAGTQHVTNTQIDLLVDGVRRITEGTISGDLFDGSGTLAFRRGGNMGVDSAAGQFRTTPWTAPTLILDGPVVGAPRAFRSLADNSRGDITNFDAPAPNLTQSDRWLASRTPYVLADPNQQASANNPPVWPAITAPLTAETFEYFISAGNTGPGNFAGGAYGQRVNLIPDAIEVTTSSGATLTVPAFRFVNSDPASGTYGQPLPGNTDLPTRVIAADADGDGIADSGLVRLTQVGDVTYFYAVRIIDQNSAINVNTAWTRSFDIGGNGRMANNYGRVGMFPSGVGLAEILRDANPVLVTVAGGISLNTLNWDAMATGTLGLISAQMSRTGGTATSYNLQMAGVQAATLTTPYTDAGGTRNDFQFLTQGDGLWHVLGRRMDSPGRFGAGLSGNPYGIGDTASLAYGNGLVSLEISPSRLENDLRLSVLFDDSKLPTESFGYRTRPFNPSLLNTQGPNFWYNTWFDYRAELASAPSQETWMWRRPMLTTWNPTSLLSPITSNSISTATSTPEVAVVDATTGMLSHPQATPKAAINKAPFGELWRAFWNVMTGGFDTSTGTAVAISPFGNTPPPTDAFLGNYFGPEGASTIRDSLITNTGSSGWVSSGGTPVFNAGPGLIQTRDSFQRFAITNPNDTTNLHPQRMFRSSLRDINRIGVLSLAPGQMVALRSALAAANAEAMRPPLLANNTAENTPHALNRDAEEIPYHDVTLQAPATGGTTYTARVFGYRPQPFITEIYANTEEDSDRTGGLPNNNGYVAIELYNPYPFPIRLDYSDPIRNPNGGWRILSIDRTTKVAELVVDFGQPAGGGTWLNQNGLSELIIQANGYLLLENYDSTGTGANPNKANRRPFSSRLPAAGQIPPRTGNQPPLTVVYVDNLGLGDPAINLGSIGNRELVIVRPPDITTAAIPNTNPQLTAQRFMPVDSFDFTGLQKGGGVYATPVSRAATWSYKRRTSKTFPSSTGAPLTGVSWMFVHPGQYDGGRDHRRQQGTRAATWDPSLFEDDPFRPDIDETAIQPPPSLGTDENGQADTNDNPEPSYQGPLFPIQLCAPGMVGWLPRNIDAVPQYVGGTNYPPNAIVKDGSNRLFRNPNTADSSTSFVDWELISAAQATTPRKYPFEGFARNGDIMQVPFIGAYVITDAGGLVEVNSITMDAAMADDTDPRTDLFYDMVADSYAVETAGTDYSPITDPPAPGADMGYGFLSREQLGRFAPLRPTAMTGTVPDANATDFRNNNGNVQQYGGLRYSDTSTDRSLWRYAFARRLLDYLTVHDPHDDYLPNAHPLMYQHPSGLVPDAVSNIGGQEGTTSAAAPTGMAAPGTTKDAENTVPVHGLININTASWRVLSAVPWVPTLNGPNGPVHDQFAFDPTTGQLVATAGTGVDDNIDLARAIVYFRDGDPFRRVPPQGPFTSLFDLHRVPAFNQVQHKLINSGVPTEALAEITAPLAVNTAAPGQETLIGDGVRYDFEEQYLLLNRVSNILTTRSDAFTAYVLLQGWRGVGSANPELVAQRRATYLIDRTNVTAKPTGGVITVQGTAPKN